MPAVFGRPHSLPFCPYGRARGRPRGRFEPPSMSWRGLEGWGGGVRGGAGAVLGRKGGGGRRVARSRWGDRGRGVGGGTTRRGLWGWGVWGGWGSRGPAAPAASPSFRSPSSAVRVS